MSWYKQSQLNNVPQMDQKRSNKIKPNDPVRRAVSSIETYWNKPGSALSQIGQILSQHGYEIDAIPSFNDRTPDGRYQYALIKPFNDRQPPGQKFDSLRIYGDDINLNNMLIFSWHWMGVPGESKCEVTAYIS